MPVETELVGDVGDAEELVQVGLFVFLAGDAEAERFGAWCGGDPGFFQGVLDG